MSKAILISIKPKWVAKILNGEEWVFLPNTDNRYLISTMGRIASVPRRRTKGGLLKPQPNKQGYLMVAIRNNGKYKLWRLSRLVALTFLPNPNNYEQGNLTKFHPLIKVNDEWENWLVNEYSTHTHTIALAPLYCQPYNFKRTGCKGCPFSLDLQEQLEVMELYMPNERKQCEWIWKPVYDEYRRLGYRLKKVERIKLL